MPPRGFVHILGLRECGAHGKSTSARQSCKGKSAYSILRDYVKAQITCIEIGALSFENAFLGSLLLADGRTVIERLQETKLLELK
jgi:hypothetical protein